MPVEITLPLTKLEQAVADARRDEQVMAAKVEEAKVALKSAKAAWEESVGALMLAVDEMIRDKRQPSLPYIDDADYSAPGGTDPNPPAPAGGGGEPTVEVTNVPVTCEVEIIRPGAGAFPELHLDAKPLVLTAGDGTAPEPVTVEPVTVPSWRALVIAEHLDGPAAMFDTLSTFGVFTLGELADALKSGRTFNLKLTEVLDLMEAVEDVSQDSAEPVRFDTEREEATERAEREEREKQEREKAEPAKPAKKPRGKRAKAEPEPVAEPEPEAAAVPSALDLSDL